MILENMPVFVKLTVDGIPFIRKIKKAMISSCYRKYISIGYTDTESHIMAWQAASLTLDYCEYITENAPITMQEYWKSMNHIMKTTRNIYHFGKSTTPDRPDQTWVNCLNLFDAGYTV